MTGASGRADLASSRPPARTAGAVRRSNIGVTPFYSMSVFTTTTDEIAQMDTSAADLPDFDEAGEPALEQLGVLGLDLDGELEPRCAVR
jgi:hypothetical protein